jgi:hypothetical protein
MQVFNFGEIRNFTSFFFCTRRRYQRSPKQAKLFNEPDSWKFCKFFFFWFRKWIHFGTLFFCYFFSLKCRSVVLVFLMRIISPSQHWKRKQEVNEWWMWFFFNCMKQRKKQTEEKVKLKMRSKGERKNWKKMWSIWDALFAQKFWKNSHCNVCHSFFFYNNKLEISEIWSNFVISFLNHIKIYLVIMIAWLFLATC